MRIVSFFSKLISNIFVLIYRTKNVAFLIGSPYHTNMGDQAQTYCITKWIKKNYPNYQIKIFKLTDCNRITLVLLKFFAKNNDMLFFHSGYHITDLYQERLLYMAIVKMFPQKNITIFPQTINFKDIQKLKETAECFNDHGKITLLCRDEKSYSTAKDFFSCCNLLLYPDIVTSLIGENTYNYERNGILFCMRNDKEALYTEKAIHELELKLSEYSTEKTDTTLKIPVSRIYKKREQILFEQFNKYAHFRLVITDRYHGTIFSLIAGTPVIVLSSSDHKLSSGVKWFPPEYFSDYIQFANNLDEAYILAQSMIRKDYDHNLPAYFKINYYDKLKEKLESFYA